MKFFKFPIALVAFASLTIPAATVNVVNVSLDQPIDAPRWMYDSSAKVSNNSLIQLMVTAKKGILNRERATCLSAIEKTYALGKSLGPWLAYNHLQCALLKDKAGKLSSPALVAALRRVDAQPNWLLYGPSVSALRSSYTAALVGLAEQQSKTDRRQAWKTIDKLQQVRGWLSSEERANTYKWAGELAFIEQNLSAAQDFLQRSLSQKESAELRSRVESIRTSLIGKKKEKDSAIVIAQEPSKAPVPDLGVSDEEKDIFARMTRAIDNQDYISATEDGVLLLQKYPGSRRSQEAAERILDIYLGLATKTDEKFRNVRESLVKEMSKADASRMSRWANNAYAKGNYIDALTLSEKSYARYDGHPDSTRVLLVAAKSALAAGEYQSAEKHLEKLLKEHSGTAEAAEATFRLGLLNYRVKKYSQASAMFERLLALGTGEDFEYRALYWRWRAQQKVDAEKAKPFTKLLIEKYPLSYYGLRAQAEINGNVVQLLPKSGPVKVELRLLASEQLAWERLQILLRAGWMKEAEKELDSLPEPQTNDERLIQGRLWAAALRQDQAMNLVNKAFEESPDLVRIPLIKIIFPEEFEKFVTKESKSSGISQEWIFSLIRQESSFRPDVKSPANAMGLMQLLPSTAAEIAKDLRVKDYQGAESLLMPDINIRLGSVYMSRLFRNFGGNIPLALAAYNAGPARLKRWLGARKGVSPLENAATSSPEVEVWIDELPWDETSFYVKSILRNWMIYRMLDGSKLTLSEPIWVDAKASPR